MDASGLDDLLARARRREPEAQARLAEVYAPRVFGLLYRLTGVRDTAEELMQETFLRVLRTIDGYEHTGKFEAWLFRIAANLARDHARARRRRNEPAALDHAMGGGIAAAGGGPDARVLGAEAGNRLVAALGQLGDGEREVILLRHYSGLPFHEIADLLGVPLGTALARAHRGLKHLRALLADDEP